MVVATTFSIGEDLEDQRLELAFMTTLANDRQQRIRTLESLLECERKECTELHQKLSSANEELLLLRKEKKAQDQNYSDALDKVKEFRTLHQQSEKKIKEMEMELLSMKTFVYEVKDALKKRNEEMVVSENDLKKQTVEMDAPKARIVELEKVC